MDNMKIHIINGPNLNMLGQREENHYGKDTLKSVESKLEERYRENNLLFFQSNHEGELVDYIQKVLATDRIVINAGAYTHTSVAIRDALLSVKVKFIEVHLSNIYSREEFRHKSLLSDIASGIIVGLGSNGYNLAIDHLIQTK